MGRLFGVLFLSGGTGSGPDGGPRQGTTENKPRLALRPPRLGGRFYAFLTRAAQPLTPPPEDPWEHGSESNALMNDLIYLTATAGFFALALGYSRFCGNL